MQWNMQMLYTITCRFCVVVYVCRNANLPAIEADVDAPNQVCEFSISLAWLNDGWNGIRVNVICIFMCAYWRSSTKPYIRAFLMNIQYADQIRTQWVWHTLHEHIIGIQLHFKLVSWTMSTSFKQENDQKYHIKQQTHRRHSTRLDYYTWL